VCRTIIKVLFIEVLVERTKEQRNLISSLARLNESAPEDNVIRRKVIRSYLIRSLVRLKKRAPESVSSEASSPKATSPESEER